MMSPGNEPVAKGKLLMRFLKVAAVLSIAAIGVYQVALKPTDVTDSSSQNLPPIVASPASEALKTLSIKGRAPKTGYERSQFGDGWAKIKGCDTRNQILARDLQSVAYESTMEPVVCQVKTGTLNDPYTGETISFTRGKDTSDDIQIDHVVALSDAWQKGAQQLSYGQRVALANDPLELLAVNGHANQQKSDGDAATWLPPNKPFRCSYVARQIAVKKKYSLWVTRSEYDAMARILNACPDQILPG